jgi:hypothetical protein
MRMDYLAYHFPFFAQEYQVMLGEVAVGTAVAFAVLLIVSSAPVNGLIEAFANMFRTPVPFWITLISLPAIANGKTRLPVLTDESTSTKDTPDGTGVAVAWLLAFGAANPDWYV